MNNNWNYGIDGNAGQIGFGRVSPVWTMLGSPSTKRFDVQLSNFNDYATWGDSSYTPASTSNSMNVGGFTTEFTYAQPNGKVITPTISGSRFAMDEFAFGITYANFTESYSSILNSNSEYGVNANTSIFTMNFRGLGLPKQQFAHFSNLLSVVSKGESSCIQAVGGYCVLANTCSYYQSSGLWDLDFKIHWSSEVDSAYFRIPLANFVSNTAVPNQCVIYVEYLNSANQDSQQIIFGGMFFQSIYAQFELSGVNAVQATLYKNVNALPGTYFGAAAIPDGNNIFAVQPMMLMTDNQTERNGLPTFTASLAGITDAHPYYMIDLTNDHSVFWNTACVQSGSLGSSSCELTPTLMSLGFNAANNSTGLIH